LLFLIKYDDDDADYNNNLANTEEFGQPKLSSNF
jgi:hypothetical protein